MNEMRTANEDLRRVAQQYNEAHGFGQIETGHWVEVDEDYARRTAEAYDQMPEFENGDAREAWLQFRTEVRAQAEWLKAAGYEMVVTTDDPYRDSCEMHEAARSKVLRVFESEDPAHGWLDGETNTLFRWVHDLFGHSAEGYSFGPRGEWNAALHHAQMFSGWARMALLTETHGQNSWVNYGPESEHNRANPGDTRYAQQKAALLPVAIQQEFSEHVDALVKE